MRLGTECARPESVWRGDQFLAALSPAILQTFCEPNFYTRFFLLSSFKLRSDFRLSSADTIGTLITGHRLDEEFQTRRPQEYEKFHFYVGRPTTRRQSVKFKRRKYVRKFKLDSKIQCIKLNLYHIVISKKCPLLEKVEHLENNSFYKNRLIDWM